MDIGNVVRTFRAIPIFDPFRRSPEPVPEPAREVVCDGSARCPATEHIEGCYRSPRPEPIARRH